MSGVMPVHYEMDRHDTARSMGRVQAPGTSCQGGWNMDMQQHTPVQTLTSGSRCQFPGAGVKSCTLLQKF